MINLDRYRTFGLREVWLESFLEKPDVWFKENTLGPVQVRAFKRYMKDAELLDKEGTPTPLCWKMSELYSVDKESVWQVIWLNLFFNSPLFNFYCLEVPWESEWTKVELVVLIEQKGYAKRTAINSVNALTNTLDNSPLGTWFGRRLEKNRYLKEGLKILRPYAMKYALDKLGENPRRFEEVFGMKPQDFHYNLIGIKI